MVLELTVQKSGLTLLNYQLILKEELNGGVVYSDGQFNDSRLNLLLALTAEKEGAILRTRCKIVEMLYQKDGKICGAISQGHFNGEERWKANVIVNATGIHADSIRQLADPNVAPKLLTSRGVHLVLKEKLFSKKDISKL